MCEGGVELELRTRQSLVLGSEISRFVVSRLALWNFRSEGVRALETDFYPAI